MPNPDPLSALDPRPARRWAVRCYGLHLLTVFGIAISNIFLGLTLLASAAALRGEAIPWARLRAIYRPLGLYVLVLAASVVASYQPRVSAGSLSELTSLATLFLGPLLLRDERTVRRLVDALTVVGGLLALHGLGQFLRGYGDLDLRIRGPFSHWMTFAGVLLLCELLLLARLVADPASRRAAWRWAAALAMALAIFGSLTRGAILAVVVSGVGLLAARRPRWLLALPPAALVVLILAPVSLISRIRSIADLSEPSSYDRICMLDAGLHMIAERPLFGLGPDMVQKRYPLYRHPTAPRYWVPHLHDTPVQLAAERGIPGLLAYAWMMGVAIAVALRRFRAEGGFGGPRADLYLGAALALAGFNLAGLFEYNWGDTEVQRIALFLLALPFCLSATDSND